MNDNSNSSVDAAQIIRRMGSEDAQTRAGAQRELHQSGLYTIEDLFALLNAEHQRRRKMRRVVSIGKYAAAVAVLLLYTLLFGHSVSIGMGIILIILNDFVYTTLSMRKTRAFQRGMSVALSQFDHLSLVGPLLDMYNLGDRESIEPALTRLLPQLQATDAAKLNAHQRERLYHQLDMSDSRLLYEHANIEFILAILKSLEQIGDEKALAHVEPLARKARNARIREAAQACLPFLQARSEQERIRMNLLRPADAANRQEELMRPVTYSADNNSTQLLRVSASNQASSHEQS